MGVDFRFEVSVDPERVTLLTRKMVPWGILANCAEHTVQVRGFTRRLTTYKVFIYYDMRFYFENNKYICK